VSYYGIKKASIIIRAKHDEFSNQNFEKFSMPMPLVKEQLAQNSQRDVTGAGARRWLLRRQDVTGAGARRWLLRRQDVTGAGMRRWLLRRQDVTGAGARRWLLRREERAIKGFVVWLLSIMAGTYRDRDLISSSCTKET
jgi:hypothetical protein